MTPHEFQALIDRIKNNDTTLTSLALGSKHISDANISDASAKNLVAALMGNKTLTSLLLIGNNIGDAGATALAAALEENTTLTSLVLLRNQISDAGATVLAEALMGNKTLTSLDLALNQIRDAGAKDLAAALEKNTTLTSLYLEGNQIGAAGAKALAAALMGNKNIVDYKADSISPELQAHIAANRKIAETIADKIMKGQSDKLTINELLELPKRANAVQVIFDERKEKGTLVKEFGSVKKILASKDFQKLSLLPHELTLELRRKGVPQVGVMDLIQKYVNDPRMPENKDVKPSGLVDSASSTPQVGEGKGIDK